MTTTVNPISSIRPKQHLSLLSHREVEGLMATSEEFYKLFRQCVLAVLNSGVVTDDGEGLVRQYKDFQLRLIQQSRGIKMELYNAPSSAFVNGTMIQGIQDHVFSALRDVIYWQHDQIDFMKNACHCSEDITEAVFRILRNADVVRSNEAPNMAVCWGGHSISREEYDFTKSVGYHMGLRGLNIATGCGVGAMKGPMKGASVGHAKQKISDSRFVGITEPGIIAAEPPNGIVNELVILPDIEKRLEAFVRLAHCIVVFPGGPGTAEEILYVLSILMQPENQGVALPFIFACDQQHRAYFDSMDKFLRHCLGDEVARYYTIIDSGAEQVAEAVKIEVQKVQRARLRDQESYGYNWELYIPFELQTPFIPSHENMAALELSSDTPRDKLCMNLRAAFSGIVAGNVKSFGIEQVQQHGPYKLHADQHIGQELRQLLADFVEQGRMSLSAGYKPSFEVLS